jgi:hypothetical protein
MAQLSVSTASLCRWTCTTCAETDSHYISFSVERFRIEHHVWPDLSMRQYQIGAPRLKDICLKYGVPYVQETIWERLRKTTDIMVGKATMRSFPTEYEAAKDKSGKDGLTWKSSNGAIEED